MAEKLSRRDRIRLKIAPQAPRKKRPPKKKKPRVEPHQKIAAVAYDAELLKRASLMVETKGMFPINAWQACGGDSRTYERYLQKARFGIEPYVGIVEVMDAATAKWVAKVVPSAWGHLLKKGDGKGLFDALGRFEKRWAQKHAVQIVRDPDLELLWQMLMEEFGAEAIERFAVRYESTLAGRAQLPGAPGAAPDPAP